MEEEPEGNYCLGIEDEEVLWRKSVYALQALDYHYTCAAYLHFLVVAHKATLLFEIIITHLQIVANAHIVTHTLE